MNGVAFNSRTRYPARAVYNRFCWFHGKRLDWREFLRLRPFAQTFDGKPAKTALCGPRSAWFAKPKAKHTRRGFFRKWKRDGCAVVSDGYFGTFVQGAGAD